MAFAAKIQFDDEVIQEIKFSGDIRLRQENFDNSGTSVDRQRQRIRLRLGMDVKLPDNLKATARFATTENGDQVSGNQTLTNNANKKPIEIDLAFLTYTPSEMFEFQGGKIKNPFEKTKTSDLMWDHDYTPEGLSESVMGMAGPVGLFANLGQFAIQEVPSDTEDIYLFSEEGGVDFELPAEMKFRTSVAHHEFTNIDKNAVGGVNPLSSNTSGARFSIVQWNADLKGRLFGLPVDLGATYAQNMAAPKTTVGGALSTAEKQDKGIHAGITIGKAKEAGSWQAGYYYKEIDQDAVVAGITDSDMPHTTNTQGHIGAIAYAITDFMKASIKHFDAKSKVVAAGADSGHVRRTQFDLSVAW